ncbi:2-oxoglutarate-dependent dioxygenase DAO-like [Pyrus ussuriensis x Pyrus communis]|uniref:2-oxoglutarate-dependent dioxygenase DAO-like n=1 Tax=Pyrus ussuriensis x Pyrus communis TaxID=2448454 RepID=A0A5N5I4Z5_9ROSA|nr:2-oxoglutarate-dependent dioxygenase DAO-like [Pyrus ussuriensis x Pyrus communis]
MGDGDEDCKTIPAINLQNFPDKEEYRKLREASKTCGCFRLVNHRIPLALMSEMKCVVRSLLDLPIWRSRSRTKVAKT